MGFLQQAESWNGLIYSFRHTLKRDLKSLLVSVAFPACESSPQPLIDVFWVRLPPWHDFLHMTQGGAARPLRKPPPTVEKLLICLAVIFNLGII